MDEISYDDEVILDDFIREIRKKKDLLTDEIRRIDDCILDTELNIDRMIEQIGRAQEYIDTCRKQIVRREERIKLLDESAMNFHRARWKRKGYIQ